MTETSLFMYLVSFSFGWLLYDVYKIRQSLDKLVEYSRCMDKMMHEHKNNMGLKIEHWNKIDENIKDTYYRSQR